MCDDILYTLLNEKDQRKYHLKARLTDDGKTCPAALHTLGKQEIVVMLTTLHDIVVFDGYSSNIFRCVDVEH